MMSDNFDGGPAFPTGDGYQHGMSLRDWLAGQALKWAGHGEWFHQNPANAAERAYLMADAMLKAREAAK